MDHRVLVPWQEHDVYYIGAGVNQFSRAVAARAIAHDCNMMELPELLDSGAAKSSIERCEVIIQDSETYRKAFNFNTGLSAVALGITAEATISFKREVRSSETSITEYRGFKKLSPVMLPKQNRLNLSLSKGAKTTLAMHGPREFAAHYGTHYVAGIRKGAIYSAMVNIQCHTTSKKYEIGTKLGLGFKPWDTGASVTFAFDSLSETERKHLTEERQTAATGWPDGELIEGAAANINKMTKANFGWQVTAVLVPYEHIIDGYDSALEAYKASNMLPITLKAGKALEFLQELWVQSQTCDALITFMEGSKACKDPTQLNENRRKLQLANRYFKSFDKAEALWPLELFLSSSCQCPSNDAEPWEQGKELYGLRAFIQTIEKDLTWLTV